MRLIDADALNDSMYHEAFETDSELQKWDSGCWIRYKMFENHLDMAPTADAVPVVRGEWTSLTECSNEGVYCSVCHKKAWKADYAACAKKNKIRSNYCPNCGAKMEDKP